MKDHAEKCETLLVLIQCLERQFEPVTCINNINNKQLFKTSTQDIKCLRNRAGMPNVVLFFASLKARVKVDNASHVLQRHPDQKVFRMM